MKTITRALLAVLPCVLMAQTAIDDPVAVNSLPGQINTRIVTPVAAALAARLATTGTNTPTGYYNFVGATLRLPESTFAALPAASGVTGKVYIVTDCSTAACTVGGGTTRAIVRSNGTTYDTLGGGATGGGDFSSNTSTSVDSELVLFSGTSGKTGKRATSTGVAKLTSGVLGVVAGTATDCVLVNGTSAACGSGGGVADPGANGVMKRTSLNVTAPAALSDILALWTSCTGFLNSDGTCSALTSSGTPIYVNAKDNGVKGDGFKAADYTVTSGSAVITSATHHHVLADVGKLVSCKGAVPITSSNIEGHLNTTVATGGVDVTNSTTDRSLTLNAPAGVNATVECTVASDDADAIDAVSAANHSAPGTTLFFPSGIYGISHTLTGWQYLAYRGAGKNKSVLKWMSTTDMSGPVLNLPNGTALGTHPKGLGVADMEFDASAATVSTYSIANKCIVGEWSDSMRISNVSVHDCPATCLGTDFPINILIEDSDIKNCGRYNSGSQGGGNGIGIETSDVDVPNAGGKFINNKLGDVARYALLLEGLGNATGFGSYNVIGNEVEFTGVAPYDKARGISDGGGVGNVYVGNHLKAPNTVASTCGICNDGASTGGAPAVGSIYNANVIEGFGHGIWVNFTNGGAPTVSSSLLKITNNQSFKAGVSAYTLTAGTGGANAIKDVELSNNLAQGSLGPGIQLAGGGGIQRLTTNGNTLIDNTGGAFKVETNVADWTAMLNVAYDSGVATQTHGMIIDAGKTVSGVNFLLNDFARNTVAERSFLSEPTGHVLTTTDALAKPCEMHVSGSATGGYLQAGDDDFASATCVNDSTRPMKITSATCWTDSSGGVAVQVNPLTTSGATVLAAPLTCGVGFNSRTSTTSFTTPTQTVGLGLSMGLGGTYTTTKHVHLTFTRTY